MILGVDVFSGYGVIDWRAAFAGGVRFAFIKCTEGNEARRNDVAFTRNVEGAKEAGILVGAYHFPYPLPPRDDRQGRSPLEQAERAFTVSKGLGMHPGELPHVVDAEWPEVGEWGKWGCSAAQISDWTRAYCEHAESLWGRPPIIYTYPFWWKTLAGSTDVSWAAEYSLWIANYKHNGAGTPPTHVKPDLPKPWTSWLFWQFSAEGSGTRVPGIPACPVDRDVFAGSMSELRRLANLDMEEDEVTPVVGTRIVDFDVVTRLPGSIANDDDPDDAA